ncbi:MAG: hypothetical protein IH957_11675 [Chloroflexi bacterium]|nr:hypothetical protein [Chloroflexota bacterium]
MLGLAFYGLYYATVNWPFTLIWVVLMFFLAFGALVGGLPTMLGDLWFAWFSKEAEGLENEDDEDGWNEFVFERSNGDRLEILRQSPGTWTVRLVFQRDDEVIDYLTPSESAAIDASGYGLSDEVVSEIYTRLADQGRLR